MGSDLQEVVFLYRPVEIANGAIRFSHFNLYIPLLLGKIGEARRGFG